MKIDQTILDWLLAGDPVIRWQVMRDLLHEPEAVWRTEQARMLEVGWVADLLRYQLPDGSWQKGRWTETPWTLLQLLDCGVPYDLPQLRKAAHLQISHLLPPEHAVERKLLTDRLDLCHVGFWLRFGSAFMSNDARLQPMSDVIFDLQLADGGWNCRIRNYPETVHSSFHTTFNVLEGLRQAAEFEIVDRTKFVQSEDRALEFMLAHRLFKSDKSDKIVDEKMTYLTFPSYWHYTVLRGLDYIRNTRHIHDPRLVDAVQLIESQRNAKGRWIVEKRIPGITFFDMEKPGSESRWNTLRALRVLEAKTRPLP